MSTKLSKKQRSNSQRLLALQKTREQHAHRSLRIPIGQTPDSSKRTVFNDDSSEEGNNRVTLFSSDSNDEEDSALQFGEKFEGVKGVKLLRLQRRIGVDQRFRLNEQFLDSDGSDCERSSEEDSDHEKEKSLAIMNSILGKTTSVLHKRKRVTPDLFKDILPLRYDPMDSNHKLLEQTPQTLVEASASSSNEEDVPVINNTATHDEISQDKFYSVNTDLKNLFSSSASHEFGFLGNESDGKEEMASEPTVTEKVISKSVIPDVEEDSISPETSQAMDSDTAVNFQFFYHSTASVEHSFYRVDSPDELEAGWAEKRTAMKESFRKRCKDAIKIATKSRKYTAK